MAMGTWKDGCVKVGKLLKSVVCRECRAGINFVIYIIPFSLQKMESPGRALYSGELALCRQLQKAFKMVLVQAEEITKSLADSKTQLKSLVNLAEQLQVRNNDNGAIHKLCYAKIGNF